MEQAKGGVVWVAKEFKARQEVCFDLHFDLLSHADRSRLASSPAFVYGYAFMSSRPRPERGDSEKLQFTEGLKGGCYNPAKTQ
jgi:hypothetical protein